MRLMVHPDNVKHGFKVGKLFQLYAKRCIDPNNNKINKSNFVASLLPIGIVKIGVMASALRFITSGILFVI